MGYKPKLFSLIMMFLPQWFFLMSLPLHLQSLRKKLLWVINSNFSFSVVIFLTFVLFFFFMGQQIVKPDVYLHHVECCKIMFIVNIFLIRICSNGLFGFGQLTWKVHCDCHCFPLLTLPCLMWACHLGGYLLPGLRYLKCLPSLLSSVICWGLPLCRGCI